MIDTIYYGTYTNDGNLFSGIAGRSWKDAL